MRFFTLAVFINDIPHPKGQSGQYQPDEKHRIAYPQPAVLVAEGKAEEIEVVDERSVKVIAVSHNFADGILVVLLPHIVKISKKEKVGPSRFQFAHIGFPVHFDGTGGQRGQRHRGNAREEEQDTGHKQVNASAQIG